MQLEEEGCLSVPGFNATVVRPSRAVVKRSRSDRRRAHRRRTRSPRPRVPARDGSPRRHGVRRSASRHQTGPDRPQDPEVEAGRPMVDARAGSAPLIVYFGTPAFAVPDAGGPDPVAPPRRRTGLATRSAEGTRPSRRGDADKRAGRPLRRSGAAAHQAARRRLSRSWWAALTPTSASSPPTDGFCRTRCSSSRDRA